MPTVAQKYVEALKHIDGMYALWAPKPNTALKPGCCGYFDAQGSWNPIVDLGKEDEATRFGFATVLPPLEEERLGKWEPACSENVTWKRVALATPLKIPQLGVDLKMKLEFSKDDQYGACLVTGPTVVNKYYPNPKTLFEDWVMKNYGVVSRAVPDVKEHGLWIITKVYETPRCAVAGWAGTSGSLSLYAGAGSLFGGAITLEGTLAAGQEHNAALWKFLPDDGDPKPDDGIGSLATGKLFKSSSNYLVPIGKPSRGDEDEDEGLVEVPDENGDKLRLQREEWGHAQLRLPRVS
ncbi:hypothetical protein QBC41DRAFT_397883 [Cercophora samala]|uniref:Uncharacterized protein n=1 Tax=Cercophora samala TaxID=330535 RepID=A0AA39Z9X4_9PEZI|nr:hypothetical protein QBC41DRAFT_397883 [Cercophora samala]